MTEEPSEEHLTEEPSEKHPWRWVGIVIPILVSIAVTVGAAWFQISRTEQQARLAEQERARNVRSTLVTIVEEHVINEKRIEIPRLTRLIDSRRREQGILTPISVLEIFERAEFNILDSRYLDFATKQKYKAVFDDLYTDYGSRGFTPLAKGPYADLVNELAKSVQEGRTTEALEQIRRIVDSYQQDLRQARLAQDRPSEFPEVLRKILRNPLYLLGFTFIYVTVSMAFFPAFRKILQRFLRRGNTDP